MARRARPRGRPGRELIPPPSWPSRCSGSCAVVRDRWRWDTSFADASPGSPDQAPLPADEEAPPPFEPAEPILITGGARGITAAIARGAGPTFPADPVDRRPIRVAVGAGAGRDRLADDARNRSRRHLIARMQREGRPPSPGLVEAQFRRLMQAREIRDNLAQMTAAGAVVHYYSADVRDEEGFGGLLDDLQGRFGPLAGVIHGAGVIEDRLVKDKTPESFDRIFQTKVVGARILTERLDPARLRVLCVLRVRRQPVRQQGAV